MIETLSFSHIQAHNRSGTQPDFCYITPMLFPITQLYDILGSQDYPIPRLEKVFERHFHSVDWTISFSKPVVIFMTDLLTEEIVESLHRYLTGQCCDISNIQVITTHHIGSASWWRSTATAAHQKTFEIVEWPLYQAGNYLKKFGTSDPVDLRAKFAEKISHCDKMFTLYGGSYTKPERCFLVLRACEIYDLGLIDFAADIMPLPDILAYTERITHYLDQSEVDLIQQMYNTYVNDRQRLKVKHDPTVLSFTYNELIDFQSTQWIQDRQCLFNLARETRDDACFAASTEKSYKPFAYFSIPIFLGYRCLDYYRDLGFWLPDDIIDWSYLDRPFYHARVVGAIDQIKRVNTQIGGSVSKYLLENSERFLHNAQLALKYIGTPVKI